jgi:phage terminase large subunit
MNEKITIHQKYQPLFLNKTRYFVVTGGRGSGKSFGVALFLLNLTYQEGEKILFTRYTLTSAYASIIPEFLEKIEMMGATDDFKINKDEILNVTTGSSILFKGIRTTSGNQTASLKSLTGITAFVLDEAEELIDETLFEKIDFSVRKKGKQNRVILIMNPATKEHWVWKRFFESNFVQSGWNGTKGDVTYIHTTYKDNKDNLPESYLESIFEMKLKRPDTYEHVILGGWKEREEGVVYSNWSIGDFVLLERNCYGQDIGYSDDPTTLVHCSLDFEGKKLYVKELLYKSGLTTSQIASSDLKMAGNGLIICDSSEPRLIRELKDQGVNIRPVKKKNIKGALLTGINMLQDLDIVVDPKSVNLVKELNNYSWKSPGVPKDKFNHGLDAIRYAMSHLWIGKNSGVYNIR